MYNSFGGMSDDEFFLGHDAMIPENDLDSINYNPKENIKGYRRPYQSGSCCCVALLPVLLLILIIAIIFL